MLPKYPKIMPMPIAENGNKNNIPEMAEESGLLSYNEGFPPITQVPVKAGGKAPQRTDFNGVLNELSQHIFFMQNGGKYRWNEELDYAAGAEILGSDNNIYQALRISGPSSGGAKDPTAPQNAAFWEKIISVEDHNNDKSAHKELFDAIIRDQTFFAGDFKISHKHALDGFLLCDGSAVSRETYADLFAVIGTAYGAGDGSTTFSLPDMRGRFIQGAVQGEDGDLGSVKEAGLPNIEGNIVQNLFIGSTRIYMNGCFLNSNIHNGNGSVGSVSPVLKINFNASNSNAIYGASETVQPPAIALNVFIKY